MYKTVPIRAKFSQEELLYWEDQCKHANSLINCAIYYTRQTHYGALKSKDNAFSLYWKDDILHTGWKTWSCSINYPELDKALKTNEHYKALAAQSSQQTLKSVGESITSYNGLVKLYYENPRKNPRPRLPKYRKKGGHSAVTFPRQALTYCEGVFYPSISRETKPEMIAVIGLQPPDFIDPDWVKEVTVRPKLGEFWIDWVIDELACTPIPVGQNPKLDYTQAWSFDHGGSNWLTGISTKGKSLIINGRKLRSMNQGYCRLVAKYKQGKSDFYWDTNLDRVQRRRNNQMRDAINKAARFIINQCLADGIGNLVMGWNEGQKNGLSMGKQNNQNFAPIPTGRLIERLKQLCQEYGIIFTLTEESYTSQASFLDGDFLPVHGEKLVPGRVNSLHAQEGTTRRAVGWEPSGQRIKRGLYRTKKGLLINADCNGAANILKKVATQLAIVLAEVGRGILSVPQRIDLFTRLSRKFRRVRECV